MRNQNMKAKQKAKATSAAAPTPKPAADSAPPKRPETEEEAAAAREERKAKAAFDHTCGISATLYAHQLAAVTGKDSFLDKSKTAFIVDLWERFKPRDAVEEMLLIQMIQTHCRHMYLSVYAEQQKNLKWSGLMYDAAESAANTFRRQMLALAEYRRPPRPKSFTAIGQANIAQQQIVQNGEAPAAASTNGKSQNQNATNEKGSATQTPALPPDAGGAGFTPEFHSPGEAVAVDAGACDGRGPAPEQPQRMEARDAVGGGRP
jgi:hypothetical protein